METKEMYTCANCRKEVDHMAEGKSLCETCTENLPTAKYNSRIKE